MARRRLTIHLVACADWHREGAVPLPLARIQLLGLLDPLTGTADESRAGRGSSLLLDGQTVPIEDYLELRPELTHRLELALANRHLEAGPWYVTPDEQLVGPEALIRNLLIARRLLGSDSMRAAVYLGPGNAHISQLPQILRGFGIETVVAAGNSSSQPLESWWYSADGSRVLLICVLDASTMVSLPAEDIPPALARWVALAQARTGTSEILLAAPASGKHWQAILAASLKNSSVRWSSIEDLTGAVQARLPALPSLAGELPPLDAPGEDSSSARAAARVWLKQVNTRVELLLQRWAEPFSLWAVHAGTSLPAAATALPRDPGTLIVYAWKLLLQNHSLAALSGNCLDESQAEIEIRFNHSDQIASALTDASLKAIASQVALPGTVAPEAIRVVVFNAAPCEQTGTAAIPLPVSDADSWEIVDSNGQPLPAQLRSLDSEEHAASRQTTLEFVAARVPPLGYATYLLQPGRSAQKPVSDEESTISNEYLSVSVNIHDGTLSLFDKRSGQEYAGLNRFEDGGDGGDIVEYRTPERDTVISIATNTPFHTERTVGPAGQSLEYLQIFRLPGSLTAAGDARLPLAAQFVPLSMWTRINLVPGVPRLDIHVQIDNSALDHRLRALFPVGFMPIDVLVDGHFEIASRALRPPHYSTLQRTFTTVMGTETGLTIAGCGLHEVSVIPTQRGAEIALTLLRSVGRITAQWPCSSRDAHLAAPRAQGIRQMEMSYAIIPHQGDPLPAWQQAWAFQHALRAIAAAAPGGGMPLSASLVHSDCDWFQVTTVKEATFDQGFIIRGYNLSSRPQSVLLEVAMPFRRAEIVRLDETPTGETIRPDRKRRLAFIAQPHQVVTLKLT